MKTKRNPVLFIGTIFLSTFIIGACGEAEQKTDNKNSNNIENTAETDKIKETPAPSTFGGLLVELESNMGWESVVPAWKKRRDSWVSEASNSSDVTTGANLLLEFESMVEWSAVDNRWANVRENWVHDCQTAADNSALADLLVIFESYVLWDVVSPNWVDLREDWIERCEEVE